MMKILVEGILVGLCMEMGSMRMTLRVSEMFTSSSGNTEIERDVVVELTPRQYEAVHREYVGRGFPVSLLRVEWSPGLMSVRRAANDQIFLEVDERL